LKAFFNWCMARSLAASNPVCRVKFFNEDNSRLRYLTEDEYSRLIKAAKAIETSPLLAEKIILSVHTGLRRGSLPHAVGLRGLSEPGRSDSADQERPATCGPPERDCVDDITDALYRALA
jgi:hypothetical protein